jgi:hypothetical protein
MLSGHTTTLQCNTNCLEKEFEIRRGDTVIVRTDIPLAAMSPEMLVVIKESDIGTVHFGKAHYCGDPEYFSFQDDLDNPDDLFLTSTISTPIVGVVWAFQRIAKGFDTVCN